MPIRKNVRRATFEQRVRATKKDYPLFESDCAEWGLDVAFFNAGFLRGDDNGKERGFIRACQLLIPLIEGKRPKKWTPEEKALFNRAMRKSHR